MGTVLALLCVHSEQSISPCLRVGLQESAQSLHHHHHPMHHPASHMRMSSTQDDTSVPLKSHLLGLIGLMNFGRFVENKCDFSRIKSPPSVGHQLWKMPFQSLQRSLSTNLNKGPLEILTRGHYGMCNAQYCFTIYLGYSSKGQFFSDIHEHRMGLLPGGEDEQGKTERNKEKEKCFRAEHSYL